MAAPGDQPSGGDAWAWAAKGFASTLLGLGALLALAVWLWLRPVREGPLQAVALWLGCALIVGAIALVWVPGHHDQADPPPVDRPHPHRHAWTVAGVLVALSVVMAVIGMVATREDRRPALRSAIDTAVAGQPVGFVRETTWAYQPRFVGDLGDSDWSVCRSYQVPAGSSSAVVEAVTASLAAQGIEPEAEHVEGDATWRYADVRVDGDDLLVVCVAEVDPDER